MEVKLSICFNNVPAGQVVKISITGLKLPLPVTLKNCEVALAVKEYQTSSKSAPIEGVAMPKSPEVGLQVAPGVKDIAPIHSSFTTPLVTQVVKLV